MTITRRPRRPASTPAPTATPKAVRRKKTAESFIEDAHHTAPPPAPAAEPEEEAKAKKTKDKGKTKEKSKGKEKHKKRKDKEAVLIRFEDDQLGLMDERAAALGLSRAAWVRMVVAKALRGKKS